jgi:rRNA processing protein Krr1/Pno1
MIWSFESPENDILFQPPRPLRVARNAIEKLAQNRNHITVLGNFEKQPSLRKNTCFFVA